MSVKEIQVGDQKFTCPGFWNVDEAENKIRRWYLLAGGGLLENGVPLLGNVLISSTTGALSFSGGQAQQAVTPTSAPPDRTVRFDVQQQIRVTAWDTLVFHMLSIRSNTTLLDLRRAVRNSFDAADLPVGDFRLYALSPGKLIGEKTKINTEDMFAELKAVYLNGDPKTVPPALYVWSLSKSKLSPDKLPTTKARNCIASNDNSSDGSQHSNNSRNSQLQREFAGAVLSRDNSRCVVCGSEENLQAAHVYNVEKHPTYAELHQCKINSLFDTANGLTKCSTCHRLYDAHLLCTNPETYRVEVACAYLHWGDEKGKYDTLVKAEREVKPQNPGWPPKELMQFRWQQYQTAKTLRDVQRDTYPEFCEVCWRRWKTKRGLASHTCVKVPGKVEHLQNLHTPVKSGKAEDEDECELDKSFSDLQLVADKDAMQK